MDISTRSIVNGIELILHEGYRKDTQIGGAQEQECGIDKRNREEFTLKPFPASKQCLEIGISGWTSEME